MKATHINYGIIRKKIIVANKDIDTSLTQFAWSKFEPGEHYDFITNAIMDENFFVLSGNEIYKIDDELLELKPGNFGIVADD